MSGKKARKLKGKGQSSAAPGASNGGTSKRAVKSLASAPGPPIIEEEEEEERAASSSSSEEEDYDSEASAEFDSDASNDSADESESESSDDGFEDQGSDSDEDDGSRDGQEEEVDGSSDEEIEFVAEELPPPPAAFREPSKERKGSPRSIVAQRDAEKLRDSATVGVNQALLHVDDLSSDDEEGDNTIGRVPLHWYDEYDHIGYDTKGEKVMKASGSGGSDGGTANDIFAGLQSAIASSSDPSKRFAIYDALNAREVTMTAREVEIIRRIQSGAYAHPEHDANPDYVDYYSSKHLDSGVNSNRTEPKARFQPSKWEALQVSRLLKRLQDGKIDMDYLTGKKKSMQSEKKDSDKPYMMWKGDEEVRAKKNYGKKLRFSPAAFGSAAGGPFFFLFKLLLFRDRAANPHLPPLSFKKKKKLTYFFRTNS